VFQESPIYNFDRFTLQVFRDFTWVVYDFEELSGGEVNKRNNM